MADEEIFTTTQSKSAIEIILERVQTHISKKETIEEDKQYRLIYTNGDVYEGEIVQNDLREGWGKQTFKKGGEYDGLWTYDKMNGYGKYRDNEGNCYEGDFDDGLKSGQGNMIVTMVINIWAISTKIYSMAKELMYPKMVMYMKVILSLGKKKGLVFLQKRMARR